ncbi:hypothetical protein M427DRAFT_398153 [Gonapodya prolifera JEL478]|uniref:Uncharacterized protein n=1 Tax=Gonapodya prolifera (strain JEL478) TaxID=1344416 RepID=A0A139A638_GONPJ|nr:hypothetical protein M427DRAFT_398153 [Gonapodya prolifera JEL478]|eukprot:KXS12266.1 hypothetical protein M427DRAFT_398153 [Gonapodya prolifera JEL478]
MRPRGRASRIPSWRADSPPTAAGGAEAKMGSSCSTWSGRSTTRLLTFLRADSFMHSPFPSSRRSHSTKLLQGLSCFCACCAKKHGLPILTSPRPATWTSVRFVSEVSFPNTRAGGSEDPERVRWLPVRPFQRTDDGDRSLWPEQILLVYILRAQAVVDLGDKEFCVWLLFVTLSHPASTSETSLSLISDHTLQPQVRFGDVEERHLEGPPRSQRSAGWLDWPSRRPLSRRV